MNNYYLKRKIEYNLQFIAPIVIFLISFYLCLKHIYLYSLVFILPIVYFIFLGAYSNSKLKSVLKMSNERINNQKKTEKMKRKWCKKLKLNPDNIRCKFEKNKSSDFYKIAQFSGGAFCDLNPHGKGYLVVLTSAKKERSNTEVALVHELLHIKEGHPEKQKKWYWYFIGFVRGCQFELTINKDLLPKYFSIEK